MLVTDFPVDLLHCVYDYLPNRDIKNVRLVCQAFRETAKLNISRTFISPNRTNLDVFRNIVNHNELCPGIKEIVWDDARFLKYDEDVEELPRPKPPMGSLGLVRDERQYRSDFVTKVSRDWASSLESIDMAESFQLYQRLYLEQQAIIDSGEDIELLRLGLTSFPALKRITVTSEVWMRYRLSSQQMTPLLRSLPTHIRMPVLWPWRGSDFPALGHYEVGTETARIQSTASERLDPLWRGYSIVVSELISTGAYQHIEEFVIDVNRQSTGISHRLFIPPNTDLDNTLRLCEAGALTRLELAINVIHADGPSYECYDNGLMKNALSRLSHLEHFDLRTTVPTYSDLRFRWVNLQNIFPEPSTMRHLKSLGLGNIFTLETSLYELLSGPPALEAIDLDTIQFPSDTRNLLQPLSQWPFRTRVPEGAFYSILSSLKSNLVTPEGGAWKLRQPRVTIRRKYGKTIYSRVTVSTEVVDFLYGHGGCPFLSEPPHRLKFGLGRILDDFDSEYEAAYPIPHYGDGIECIS